MIGHVPLPPGLEVLRHRLRHPARRRRAPTTAACARPRSWATASSRMPPAWRRAPPARGAWRSKIRSTTATWPTCRRRLAAPLSATPSRNELTARAFLARYRRIDRRRDHDRSGAQLRRPRRRPNTPSSSTTASAVSARCSRAARPARRRAASSASSCTNRTRATPLAGWAPTAPIASSSWCARPARPPGLFGAKITGGGSGGTVAVLAAAGKRAVVDAIADATGKRPDATPPCSPARRRARARSASQAGPMTVRRAAAVVAAAALALGGAACRRGDWEIRDGFTAAFDAPPVVAVAPCPDEEAKLARLQPLLDLAARSYKDRVRPRPLAPGEDVAATVKKGFDAPLPADLSADLLATEISGSRRRLPLLPRAGQRSRPAHDGDCRPVPAERRGAARDPARSTPATNTSSRGSPSTPSRGRMRSSTTWARATSSVASRRSSTAIHLRPPSSIGWRRRRADGLLSRAQLCAGIKVEFLTQAYVPFQDRLAPLRGRVAERWGERTVSAFAEIADRPEIGRCRALADDQRPLRAAHRRLPRRARAAARAAGDGGPRQAGGGSGQRDRSSSAPPPR